MHNEGDPFSLSFTISEGSAPGSYAVEGFMDPTKGDVKYFGHLTRQNCKFYLLIANDGVIIDNIQFYPRGEDLEQAANQI